MTAALKACQAQARGTWQYVRDFNRLNTATTTARELYDGMQEIYPIASTRAGSERSKHRQEAAMRHTATLTSRLLVEGAALPAASSANVVQTS